MKNPIDLASSVLSRAEQLYAESELLLYRRTDRRFAVLLLLQWLAGIIAALWFSPFTWAGAERQVHLHIYMAVILGGAISGFPALLATLSPGQTATRHTIAVAQMLSAGLLIHLTGGRIESHFQIFGALAFLACYRDWRVLATASAVVAIDHLVRGLLFPQSIFGVLTPNSWRWLEHAGWVLFEDAFLLVAIAENLEEMRSIAARRAELEASNAAVETKVKQRTEQLTREIVARQRQEEELARACEAAKESARLKAEFLANMSHEIRTPLNGIIGMTGLLLDTDLSPQQKEFTEIIRSSGDALLTVVNDILDFSKIDAGKLTFEILDFELQQTVEGVVEMLAERAASKGLELVTLIGATVPRAVRGDPGRLRQVLMNLIGNAIKFTDRGEVMVRVLLQRESVNDLTIRVEVQDTGIGIAAATVEKLFHAFRQADGSTTRKYGGTGLGLAISKRLVELMDGEIGVSSKPGEGSTFFFTARLDKQPRQQVERRDSRVASLQGLRILIVDDNENNRMVLRLQLRNWGISTQEAACAQEARALLRSARGSGQPFHLAVLDMQMPGCDGLQLAEGLQAEKSLGSTKLIMMTSLGGNREYEARLREAGVLLCLTKPVKQSRLQQALTTVLAPPTESDASSSGSAWQPIRPQSPPARRQRVRILVAEDNPVNQKVILRQLSKLGFRADAVGNGREALKALQHIPYEVVLMDCQMPDMDGYSATQEQRRRENGAGHVYILALTASTMEGDRERCLKAGMDDYLSKPLMIEDLDEKLTRWMEANPSRSSSVSPVAGSALAPKAAVGAEGPPPAAAMEAPVDVQALRASTDADPAFMREMIDLYLMEGARLVASLDQAHGTGAVREVERIAHTLAGSSLTFGMRAIATPLRQLESMAAHGSLRDGATCLSQVHAELARIRDFFGTVSTEKLCA